MEGRAWRRKLMRDMYLCRLFEERLYLLFLQGEVPGTVHQSQGQEAVAVGVCSALGNEDYITSTHRPISHMLAKGVDPKSIMAEIYGRVDGCCRGKGGSMHIGDMSIGAVPAIAIVGGGIPVATGLGLAAKMRRSGQVVACMFGDGAVNEGSFHESMNMGAIWDLPVVYVCENNLYGASTHISKVVKVGRLSERAAAYGMPGETVDGNDVLAVHEAIAAAVARARGGSGPTMVECVTYRRRGHSRNDANQYRDKAEQELWLSKDPILRFRNQLLEQGDATAEELDALEAGVNRELDEVVEFARQSPWPDPKDGLLHVFYGE